MENKPERLSFANQVAQTQIRDDMIRTSNQHDESNSAYGQPVKAPSRLGTYANLPNQICGQKGVAWDITTIPQIGCFALSSGKSATGTFLGITIVVSVGADGNEVITADGKPIPDDPRQTPLKINNINVLGAGGVSLCPESNRSVGTSGCVAGIEVISRNSDKSINYYVSQCFDNGQWCVTNQENWDRIRQERGAQ